MTNKSEGNIILFRNVSLICVGDKEILKNAVLKRALFTQTFQIFDLVYVWYAACCAVYFLGEQKMKDRASAESQIKQKNTPRQRKAITEIL